MVSPRFYEPSAGLVARLPELRRGRVLSCDPTGTPEYQRAFAGRLTHHETWTFALLRDTLSPFTNMPLGVRGALGVDPTGLVPPERALSPRLARCLEFDAIASRVLSAGVTHVLTTIPVRHTMLGAPEAIESPDALPLPVYLQRVMDPLPLWEVQGASLDAGGLEAELVSSSPGAWHLWVRKGFPLRLIVREAWSRGWRATVDGRPRSVERTSDGHLLVSLVPGERDVSLEYEPPWLRWSLALSAVSLAFVLSLAVRGRRREVSLR